MSRICTQKYNRVRTLVVFRFTRHTNKTPVYREDVSRETADKYVQSVRNLRRSDEVRDALKRLRR